MAEYDLIISDSLGGGNVSDTLRSGGSGLDFGKVPSSSYTPKISQDENTGHKDVFIRHLGDGVIERLSTYLSPYDQSYGGDRSSELDFKNLLAMGKTASPNAANNIDGGYSGLAVEMNRGATGNEFFNPASATVEIYGRNDKGSRMSKAFLIKKEAMLNSESGESPSGAQDGKLGESGNSEFGDTVHIRKRVYMGRGEKNRAGGFFQWDLNFIFSHLA